MSDERCPTCGCLVTGGCNPTAAVCVNRGLSDDPPWDDMHSSDRANYLAARADEDASYARVVVTGGDLTAYNARQAAGDARAAARGPVTYEIDDVPPNAGSAS
jgi:hypothetical protein